MVPKTNIHRVTYALKTTLVLTSIRAAFYGSKTFADASVYAGGHKPASHCRKAGDEHQLPKLAGIKCQTYNTFT